MRVRKYLPSNLISYILYLRSILLLFLNSLVSRGAMNEPELCFTWRSHVKTFDGRYFYFPGRCTYKLIHDCQDDLFSVHVFTDPFCNDLKNCRRAVNLYLGEMDIKVNLFCVKERVHHTQCN